MSDDQDGCEWVNVFFWYRPTQVVGPEAVKQLCVCARTRVHSTNILQTYPAINNNSLSHGLFFRTTSVSWCQKNKNILNLISKK